MSNWKSVFGLVAAVALAVPAQGVLAEPADSWEAGSRWEQSVQWENTAQWEQAATWEATPTWEATAQWESQRWENTARWESVSWEAESRPANAQQTEGTHSLYAQGLVSFSEAH